MLFIADFNEAKYTQFISARHGVKAKLPFRLDINNEVARGTVDIIAKNEMDIIKTKYKTPIGIPYKGQLADTKLETGVHQIYWTGWTVDLTTLLFSPI